jgi:uncharacterized phage protein (TIGR01671 family)
MEDRYLFKVKRADNGEWVVWNALTGIPHDTSIIQDTICQCAGLKDKNGKLIWENDILMCYDNTDNLVKVAYGEFDVIDADSLNVSDSVIGWHHEVVSMDALKKYELLRYDMLPLTEYYIQLMESKRIGNIFDNPELIKEI